MLRASTAAKMGLQPVVRIVSQESARQKPRNLLACGSYARLPRAPSVRELQFVRPHPPASLREGGSSQSDECLCALQPAIAAIRRRFSAMHTSLHSARTRCSPRRLNCRKMEKGRLHKVVAGQPLPAFAREIGANNWAQFFIKWVMGNPAVTTVLTGTSNPEHAAQNVATLRGPLPDAAMRQRMGQVVVVTGWSATAHSKSWTILGGIACPA
jgi:hypothetical protein